MFYVNIFFIYSFLGFLFESIFSLIIKSHFNSGILYGPWTFIYAFGIFAIMGFNKLLEKKKLKKWLEVIIFFIFASVAMSFIEFCGGMIIEKWFHKVYWDYTNMKFNIGHYICLEASFFWGVFATFINYVVAPKLEKFAKTVPWYVTIVFVILFILDIIMTIIN